MYGGQSPEWLRAFDGERLTDQQISEIDQVVAQWITDYEDRHARTAAAKARARSVTHRAQRTVRAAVVVNAIAIAWLVAAAVNRDMLRVFDRFVRLGGGLAALCYLVIPVTLPAAGAVLAYRARSSTTRAKLKNNNRTYLIMSSAALAAWLTTFVAIWIAG